MNGDVAVPEVAISYGLFLNTIITFIIVAFAIFMVVKGYNNMKSKMEKKEAETPAAPPAPTNEEEACYGDITMPTPPTVLDNCGVAINPTGPVEGTVTDCEGDVTYTWTYTDCEGNSQDYVHTVTIEYEGFPVIPGTTDTVACYADIAFLSSVTVIVACFSSFPLYNV